MRHPLTATLAAALLMLAAGPGAAQSTAEAAVPATELIRELPTVIAFTLFEFDGEETPTLMARREVPEGSRLGLMQEHLRYALTWLVEGAPSYDRSAVARAYPGDSVAMRRHLLDALSRDERFTSPLLALAVPLLHVHGVRVDDVVAPAPLPVTEDQLVALAARYFQVGSVDGRQTLSVCAKPQLMRDRPLPRNDAVEAWLYSAVRLAVEQGGLMRNVGEALTAVSESGNDANLETRLWRELESGGALRAVVRAHYERTAAWAPVRLVSASEPVSQVTRSP